MTVSETILSDLRRARGWFCGASWYASFRPTFAQRISELRRGGVDIESRVCKRHKHRGGIHEYRLAPAAGRLIA